MGQGKLDLFGKAFEELSTTQTRCVICSRVALGVVSNATLAEVNLNEYLRETNVPSTNVRYWNAITGQSGEQTFVDDLSGLEQAIRTESFQGNITGDSAEALAFTPSSSTQLAFVFAQRKTEKGFLQGALAGATDATFLLVGVGTVLPGVDKFLLTTKIGWVVDVLVIGGTSAYAGINSWSNQQASALYCGTFSSSASDANREGCSIVRAVPYSAQTVNQICQEIEGTL